MKRSNTSFIISLIIHVLAALLFALIHRGSYIRWGLNAIPVEFNVEAPRPKLEREKPRFEPMELNPERRPTDRKQSQPLVKIKREMDKTTAYRDVIITDDSETLTDMDMQEGDLGTGGSFTFRTRARGAGPGARGDKSQLVEFVDKSKGDRRIIYCMDVSASMGASNKLNLARNYLKDSLLALDSERDKFNVIAFARDVRIFRDEMLPVKRENLTAAMRFLDEYTPQNIKANSKTDLLAVLIRALEMKPNIIALVTDGLPTAGVTNPEKIIQSIREKNMNGDVRIFAIGMEMDLEQPEAWLLRTIAEQNSGEFQFF